MRKWIVIVLGAAAALLIGWQVLSPWIAMDALRDAAREGDRDTLEENIDFPALRASVKAELFQQIEAEARKRGDEEGLASIGTKFAKGFVDGTVDAVITPSGVSGMLTSGSLIPRTQGTAQAQEIDWKVKWVSFDTFHAYPAQDDGTVHPALVFKRDGLGWKLSGLDIP